MNPSLSMKIDDAMKKWSFNGIIYVTHMGEKMFEGAYGLADFEDHIPNTMDSTFYIASVTKQFTAVCIMLLYEKELLDIEDTLDKYLPEYTHAKEITLRQLMNMSSGIPDYLNDVINDRLCEEEKATTRSSRDFFIYSKKSKGEYFTVENVLPMVNELPLQFTPGERMQYSNTNYVFLDRVIESVSGKSTDDYLRENIFEPLGMTHTCVGSQHSTSVSYDDFDGERVRLGRGELCAGDGSIVTTTEDLSLWLNAVLDGRILSESSWRQTFEIVHNAYGFGWHQDGCWYCHDGGDLGYDAYVYICFKKKLAIAMTANIPSGRRPGESIFYKFKAAAPTTGLVKIKLAMMNSGAEFHMYTVDIYDESVGTLLASVGRTPAGDPEEEVLWSLKNEGEPAEAETFSVNEGHLYHLDLQEILGERFSSAATYHIEASVSATDYTVVHAGYHSGEENAWTDAMGMYIGTDLIEERIPKLVYEAVAFPINS